jgi:hypothetical protein
MTGFYVYSRTEPRYIVSLAEIKAEPELVAKAQEEKRAPEILFPCAREPEIVKKKTLPWSHYPPLPGMIKYYVDGSQSSKSGGEGDLYGGAFTPGKMNFSLRAGESFTRSWDFEKGKYPAGWAYAEDAETGPYHRCGHNDEFDKANFPYWEPYKKENVFVYRRGGEGAEATTIKRCYRYFTNARLDRVLPAAELLAAASAKSGVKLDGDALVAEGGAAGTLELITSFPYFICDADAKVSYSRPAEADAVSLAILEKADPKKPEVAAREFWKAGKTGDAAETGSPGRFDGGKVDLHKYTLRLTIGGAARVKQLDLSTVTLHNMYAGPYLVPGPNKITVTVDNPEELTRHKLVVTYKFADGEGWKDEHSVEKIVDKSPFEFTIDVKGPKHPKMLSVGAEVR